MIQAKPTVILDTNIFLDITSCHDLKRDVEELFPRLGNAALDDPSVHFRLVRAREASLLAMLFHKTKTTTWSLHHEPISMLLEKAPPAPGGHTMESDFVMTFAWFVKDFVLNGWNQMMPRRPGTALRDAADLALIEHARTHKLPIITAEGVTKDGIFETKRNNMRKRCRDAGVDVFAPREYIDGKIDPDQEIEAFLARFRERADVYLERRARVMKRDRMNEVLEWVYGHHLLVLKGEVDGRPYPIDVRPRAKSA